MNDMKSLSDVVKPQTNTKQLIERLLFVTTTFVREMFSVLMCSLEYLCNQRGTVWQIL